MAFGLGLGFVALGLGLKTGLNAGLKVGLGLWSRGWALVDCVA